MRITILGTRGNVESSAHRHARHSGVLVDGEVLLDLGESAYLEHRPRAIFVTHLHPDHAVFMERDLKLPPHVELYVPEATKKLPAAHVMARSVELAPYRVVPVPTIHSERVRSFGYIVQKDRKSFFYSSDMLAIEPRHLRRLRGMQLVITEGSYMRRGGLIRINHESGARYGHAGIPDLVALFQPFATRIVITHFGSWFYKDVAASVRKIESLSHAVSVLAAHDGMTVEV